MKLLFINFCPLSISSGHTFRLSQELIDLSKLSEVSVLCAKKGIESDVVKNKYKYVTFYDFDSEFDGWDIKNIDELAKFILDLDKENDYDLIVVNMEVWELLRAVSTSRISKKIAAIFHGMPFIGFMHDPSWNFDKDVLDTIQNQEEEYKVNYNLKHYKECLSVLSRINCIASNKTVAHSFSMYFPNLKISVMDKYPSVQILFEEMKLIKEYDFLYFARIEKGKGIEYLSDILSNIQTSLNRKIRVAIAGRIDDGYSKNILNNLLDGNNSKVEISYFGHVDHEKKHNLLQKTKVMLYPSVYDNNPTVIYEALSFGIPVVVWDTSFFRFNFSQYTYVKAVKFCDVYDFANTAILLLNHQPDEKNMSDELRNELYKPEEIASFDLSLFELIKQKNV